MSEETIDRLEFDLPMNRSSVIKVIGVGGGGSNAVNHMQNMGIKDVNYIICNTDAQALDHSDVSNKVQLGASLTEGMGAGANPETGRDAAIESLNEIQSILETNTKMLFVTAGMGGGTGTGAAPIIAKHSQEMGLLTVGIVTMPFSFEGTARMKQAEEGLRELKKHVDSLIVIKNDKLREVYGNLGFKKGFQMADSVLATAVKAIAEVITSHYGVNIDLKDAKTVLANSGTAIMGSSVADGDNRAKEAIIDALDSPLLNDNQITGAKNVLLLIISGDDNHEITIDEIGVINEHVQSEAGGSANIILGIGQDEELKSGISVTVIATGFEAGSRIIEGKAEEQSRTVIHLDSEIKEDVPEPIVDEKPDPLTTRINQTNSATGKPQQVDLFAMVEEVEATQTNEPEAEADQEIEASNEALEEDTEDFVGDFKDEIHANEVVFELTQNTKTEETQEEPKFEKEPISVPEAETSVELKEPLEEAEEETTFTLEDDFEMNATVGDFKRPEPSQEEEENETSEEEIVAETEETHFSLSDFEDENTSFVISDEIEDSFETEEEMTSEIVANHEEEKTEIDPLNFRIDEVHKIKSGILEPEESHEEEMDKEPISEAEPKPEKVTFTLDDLRDMERKLGAKTPTMVDEEDAEAPQEVEDTADFQVKKISQRELEEKEEMNPIHNKIDIAQSKLVRERTKKFSEFQHTFNSKYTDSKEPAFKRQGIEVQNNGLSDEENLSRLSVNGDGKDLNINSSNSFLHDNVD